MDSSDKSKDGAAAGDPQPSQPPTAASGATSSGGGGGQATKCVYIFRNGDVFAPSKKFVLNRRHLRDWDVFLEQVTLSVNPLRGAVRTIVTPKRGRRRIQDLDSFDDKAHYVALAKGEKFKPMTYVPEGEATGADGADQQHHHDTNGGQGSPTASPRKPPGGHRIVLEPILPVVHNKKLMSIQPRFGIKMDMISSQSKVIRVYRNGDEFTPAIITRLRPSEQVSMEVVLRAVEEKVVLPNNMAIRKLYDLSGRRIRDPAEIQDEKHYVVGGHELFMPRPYGQKLPVIVIGKAEKTEGSTWSSIKYLSQPITPEKNALRKTKSEQQQQQQQSGTQEAGAAKTNRGGASESYEQQRFLTHRQSGGADESLDDDGNHRDYATDEDEEAAYRDDEAHENPANHNRPQPNSHSNQNVGQEQQQQRQLSLGNSREAPASRQLSNDGGGAATYRADQGRQLEAESPGGEEASASHGATPMGSYEDPVYHQAATKIQATYRGYRSRKQLRTSRRS